MEKVCRGHGRGGGGQGSGKRVTLGWWVSLSAHFSFAHGRERSTCGRFRVPCPMQGARAISGHHSENLNWNLLTQCALFRGPIVRFEDEFLCAESL